MSDSSDPMDCSLPGSSIHGIFQEKVLEWGAIALHEHMLNHVQLFCNPMDCSPPGSSVHGIFQARVLEWGAIAFSVKIYELHVNLLLKDDINIY